MTPLRQPKIEDMQLRGLPASTQACLWMIGQGGMGEVFLAEDTLLEHKVVIRFLLQAMPSDAVAREGFLREAKSATTLDHPQICVIYEAGAVEGVPFIVLEYVERESQGERMARGPLCPRRRPSGSR